MPALTTSRREGHVTADETHSMDNAQDQNVAQSAEKPANALFFARCPPTLPYEELLQVFSQYGDVKELNLYRRWAKAKNSKGCGTVLFNDKACAQAAMEALNGNHEWPESEAKMVVEWCVPEKLHVKSATEGSVTGTKLAFKPKSTSKSTKSQPLLKLQNGDEAPSHQRLREAWSHSWLDGHSSGSDQDSPIPAHLVPMMAGMMFNSPAGPLCNHHLSSAASNPLIQLPNNWTSAPDTLLHNMMPMTKDCLDQDEVTAALSSLQNNRISSCNSSFTSSLWGCNSSPDLQPYISGPLLPDAEDIWQQQQAAFAAVAANTGLTSTRSSVSGGISGTMPCGAVFDAASLCSLMDEASPCGSTEYACDSLTGGAFMAPEYNTSLPPPSAAALNLLQLEQQQNALMLANFSAATTSSPLPIVPEQYITTAPGTTPAGLAAHPASAAVPKLEEVRVDLNSQSLNVIATSINTVATVSGAHVTIDASRGGLQLSVTGVADQVEAACNCLCYVLSVGGLEGTTGRCK